MTRQPDGVRSVSGATPSHKPRDGTSPVCETRPRVESRKVRRCCSSPLLLFLLPPPFCDAYGHFMLQRTRPAGPHDGGEPDPAHAPTGSVETDQIPSGEIPQSQPLIHATKRIHPPTHIRPVCSSARRTVTIRLQMMSDVHLITRWDVGSTRSTPFGLVRGSNLTHPYERGTRSR